MSRRAKIYNNNKPMFYKYLKNRNILKIYLISQKFGKSDLFGNGVIEMYPM